MTLNRYFRDELTFLKEQGKAYADHKPQLSRFLNARNADPDVDRLLEGFAFLTARLREKVDDEFPELTHSIIHMLWPNYLRPVPSLTMVQFSPIEKTISSGQRISKGTQLESHPVLGTSCQFRTCRDVLIYPLIQTNVDAYHTRDSSFVEITFTNQSDDSLNALNLTSLRLHLSGEQYSAQMLYLWLSHYLTRVEVVFDDKTLSHPLSEIKPVGFDNSDSLLPYPKNVYEGYRIIQEYLCFAEGFLYFDIEGLHRTLVNTTQRHFILRFCFNKNIPHDVRVTESSFALYCTPAINLFEHDIDPIDLDGKSTEYRIKPSGRTPSHYELFSLDKVQGWAENKADTFQKEQRIYTPFESFQHEIERAKDRKTLYFRLRVKEGLHDEGLAHFISFVRSDESEHIGFSEAISLQATCTNRQLPLDLGKGDICIPTDSCPPFATFTNITQPTAPLAPVLDGTLLWTLISNLSLNYLSLLSKDALSSVLRAYDFKALVDRQAELISRQRLDAIMTIETQSCERLFKGLPIRGLRTEMTLSEDGFANEGDLYLFGSILSRFFSLYVSINSFHELVVINANNQERYSWGMQTGSQPLI